MKRAALAVLLAFAPVLFAQTPYIVKELHPGANTGIQSPGFIAAAEHLVYFSVRTGETLALWVTDGTANGTIELGPLRQFPLVAHTAGRSVYFQMDGELWTSDGTPQGTGAATELVARFPQRPYLRNIIGDTILAEIDFVLYATKVAPGSPVVRVGAPWTATAVELAGHIFLFTGRAMWETDGTVAGTRLVTETLPHPAHGGAAVLRGEIYFATSELWKTDGTIDGTVRVTTLPAAATGLFTVGDRMFFFLRETELWVTDGTANGTRALPAKLGDAWMAAVGDRLVFSGLDAERAIEPWVSDGTVEGTKRLADLVPGNAESWAGDFVSTGDTAYFSGLDPAHGRELWVTDGTPEGTRLVIDAYPGPFDGLPFLFAHANERFLFAATAPVTGRELYAIDLPVPARVLVDDVRVAEENTVARFTVRLSKAATETMTIAYATSDGDAAAGTDYAATTGTITFAPGELAKTIDVPVFADTLFETHERFFFTAGTATAFAMIEDDDRAADLALRLDFAALSVGTMRVYARNLGPATATKVRPFVTQTPADPNTSTCATCEGFQLASGEEASVVERRPIGQAWFSVAIRANEHDPQPSNDTVAWTQAGTMALDAPWITVGAEATLYVAPFVPGAVTVESSNPAVIAVPATITGSGSVRGVSPGRATIRAFANNILQGTMEIDVVAAGTTPRSSGALDLQTTGTARIDQPFHLDVRALAIAPFTQHTATGAVTISHNGAVVARGTLTAGSPILGVDLYGTSVGRNDYTVAYEGDAHFLPQTLQFSYPVSIGRATLLASVDRDGTRATIRVRVTGSPVAPPTGSVRVQQFGVIAPVTVPLVDGEAVVTLTDVPASARTATLSYFGDDRYGHVEEQISLLERRRAVRH